MSILKFIKYIYIIAECTQAAVQVGIKDILSEYYLIQGSALFKRIFQECILRLL